MSQYTFKTGLSSILKNYSTDEREKIKLAALNKVRFELPKEKGLLYMVEDVLETNSYQKYGEFLQFLTNGEITDADFKRIIADSTKCIHSLKIEKFPGLIATLMSMNWINRDETLIECFKEFIVEISITHNNYSNIIITKLLKLWIPSASVKDEWINGTPSKSQKNQLENVHDLISRLLNVNPILCDVLTESIENLFPYFKKSPHEVGGYFYNCLWFVRYRPEFLSFVIEILIKNLLKMDVNAPRNEIEDAEEQYNDETNIASEAMFEMELNHTDHNDIQNTMCHEVAEVLDICIGKLLEFSKEIYDSSADPSIINRRQKNITFSNYFKILLDIFEKILLPSHNTHHIQFLLFYCCSFKSNLMEKFLNVLWNIITSLNVSAPLRQAAIGYLASFLSRAKFVPLSFIKHYLNEMCKWAHQYIARSDCIRSNISLKANVVFFALCQAIFYVIAFRSKDLTKDKQNLLFLQSLQLSSLVTCTYNPLRVCLSAVATAFAGVTRAYQLAYCHTILERNARRKLATIYSNELVTPEEYLDTFFPFDPYLLKKSGNCITPIYLQYQAHEIEEIENSNCSTSSSSIKINRRKRGDSEMEANDDVDDFITSNKNFKYELSKSHEKEMQFNYGLSPGFHF